MKKVLLATTMLVAGASIAAAEVTVSGDARMGVVNNFAGDTSFNSRARVAFALSAESESGLSFGASFRADNALGASSGTGAACRARAGAAERSPSTATRCRGRGRRQTRRSPRR